jgi:hypothetical protein
MRKKNKEEIIVVINFHNGMKSRLAMPNFKAVKKALCNSDIERFGEWIRCDELYDPENAYKITKLTLDKNGNLKSLELTENWEGGLNER